MEALTISELSQFVGTTQYFPHSAGRVVFTEGVQYLAERGGAYWLIDAIASYNRQEPFQIWELKKHQDNTATLTMREDTGRPTKVRQEISYTDFPLEGIKLYLIDGVLLLPSEY